MLTEEAKQLRLDVAKMLHDKWTSGLNHLVVYILTEDVARFIEEREAKWMKNNKQHLN